MGEKEHLQKQDSDISHKYINYKTHQAWHNAHCKTVKLDTSMKQAYINFKCSNITVKLSFSFT